VTATLIPNFADKTALTHKKDEQELSMLNDLTIRRMRAADLPFAAQCTAGEGWASETLASFEEFYQHDPEGCLLAERAGHPVGICIATPYGHSGFVGELTPALAAQVQVSSARKRAARGLARRC
jgi:hypothetical protein